MHNLIFQSMSDYYSTQLKAAYLPPPPPSTHHSTLRQLLNNLAVTSNLLDFRGRELTLFFLVSLISQHPAKQTPLIRVHQIIWTTARLGQARPGQPRA